jgi:hypothetical protein
MRISIKPTWPQFCCFPPQDAISRELDIGVARIEENGRFPPQLMCEGGDVLGGGSGNNSAHAAAPREENGPDQGNCHSPVWVVPRPTQDVNTDCRVVVIHTL